jgi:FkbH-like protein
MYDEQSLSSYMKNSKKLNSENFDKKIKVAILSSFTLNGLPESIRVKLSTSNIFSHTFLGGYNQYNEEIINKNSKLYSFSPDICFLFLDARKQLGELYFDPYSIDVKSRTKFIHNKFEELINLIEYFLENSNSKLILNNLFIPTYSSYGILEKKIDYGLQEMIMDFNKKVSDYFKNNSSVYVYDFNSFVTRIGENQIFDYRQYFLGDVQISLRYIPHLANDLLGYIKPILGINKKCIVLDLDNTLWGGIIGEDGISGIKLGSIEPIGKAFVEFQKYLLALHNRGIILAINSKNNLDDAMEVFQNHPDMILKEKHFASLKINWNDKVLNLKEISQEINIGLDSMVFFDDDPVNRDFVRTLLPEILTVELSDDPSLYISKLIELNEFNVLKITNEDKQRGKMYQQQRKRIELKDDLNNFHDYLKKLNVKIHVKEANEFSIPRISQLTLKTNQFNLTTKRYQEKDIKTFSNDKNKLVISASVEDKFGDNGITGAVIIQKLSSQEWLIDTFLLSCRIMGREIENSILNFIVEEAKNGNVKKLIAEYIPTKKNKPAESFLSDYGFKEDGTRWIFHINQQIQKNSPHKLVVSK